MKKTFLFLVLLSIFSNAQHKSKKNSAKERLQQTIQYSNAKYLLPPTSINVNKVADNPNSELMAFMQMPEIIILNSEDDSDIKIDAKIEDSAKIESVDADIPAKFNGIGKDFKRYLFRFDTEEIYENIEDDLFGNAVLTFIIEKDGAVTDIKMVQPFNKIADKEMIRVFRKMPKFYPAEHSGKWIKCRVVVPFRFEVKARKKITTLISDPVISIKNNY